MLKWTLAPLSALKSIFAFCSNERKHVSLLDTHFFSLPRLLIRISLEDTLKIKWWTVELRLLIRWCCLVFYSWAKVFPVFSSGAAACVWFRLDLAFGLGCPFVMIGLLSDCSLGVLHGLHEWGAGNLISNSCRIRDARVWGVTPEFAVSIEIMILQRTLPSLKAGECYWLLLLIMNLVLSSCRADGGSPAGRNWKWILMDLAGSGGGSGSIRCTGPGLGFILFVKVRKSACKWGGRVSSQWGETHSPASSSFCSRHFSWGEFHLECAWRR